MTATDQPHPKTSSERSTTRVNTLLAAAVITGWLIAHIYSVFFVDITLDAWPLILGLFLLNTWLSVGLFIVAHDCMHGVLVPFKPRINRAVGQLCLTLYAGFSFDTLNRKHHLHHRHSGTADDPDFHERPPHGFWRWFANFLSEYFSWGQYLHMTVRFVVYVFVLGAAIENALLLWSLPAILSALQLFLFGTYLPHRPGAQPFSDRHRSRSNDYPWIVSLMTCFHFGYHHEHHLHPNVPWWRLPQVRTQLSGEPAGR